MNTFFDTSALIKKYIAEDETESVEQLFLNSQKIFVSYITKIECIFTLRRLKHEKAITDKDYTHLKKEINTDFEYYTIIEPSEDLESLSISCIEKFQLKTLDSIQLSCALFQKDEINFFIGNDEKLINSAKKEGFEVIKPKRI